MKYKIPELENDEDLHLSLKNISKVVNELNARRDKGLSKELEKKIKKQLMVSHVYHSNAIEGNQLTLRETELILNNMVINDRPLKDELEAQDLANATEYLQDLISGYQMVNHRTLNELHGLVLKNSNQENAGIYRKDNVRIRGSNHTPPDHLHIEELMKDMFQWMNRNMSNYDPLELGAILHHWITWVHPFTDGNGRVSRLFLNFFLLQKGYPEITIRIEDRDEYYDALAAADNGKINKLILLISKNARKSIDMFEEFINEEERRRQWLKKYKQEGEKHKEEAKAKQRFHYNIWNSNMEIFKNIIQRILDDISDIFSHLDIVYESYEFSMNKYLDMMEGKKVTHTWLFRFTIYNYEENKRWAFQFFAAPQKFSKPLKMLGVNAIDKKTGKPAIKTDIARIITGISHRKGGEHRSNDLREEIDLVNVSIHGEKLAFRLKNRENIEVNYKVPPILLDTSSSPEKIFQNFISQILEYYFNISPEQKNLQ